MRSRCRESINSCSGDNSILIMDDDESVLSVTEKMLSLLGYTVTPAHHGEEALELYEISLQQGRPFSLVILDLTIPDGMGAIPTVSEIKKLDPEARVIITSGFFNDSATDDLLNSGFCGILKKPYRMKDIMIVLERALKL